MAILDPSRIDDWQEAGVPGGIPDYPVGIYMQTTTPSWPYYINPDGVTDNAASVTAALNACPQYHSVLLPDMPGLWFNFTTNVYFPNNRALMGAGPGRTNILQNAQYLFRFAGSGSASLADIASGYEKGSTQIVVAAGLGPNFPAGSLVQIDQLNDPDYVFNVATLYNGTVTTSTDGREGGARAYWELFIVENQFGDLITLDRPISIDFKVALLPQIYRRSTAATLRSGCGIENMTIRNNFNGGNSVYFQQCYASWLRDVELYNTSWAINTINAYKCEVRRCYLHDAYSTNSSTGYGIHIAFGTSGFLVVDTILDLHRHSIITQSGGACNVSAYNYIRRNRASDGSYQWQEVACGSHRAHNAFMLWEGNYSPTFFMDNYHGSSSHYTFLRNWANCLNPGEPAYTVTQNRVCFGFNEIIYYNNCIGNILGYDGIVGYYEREPFQNGDLNVNIGFKLGHKCCNHLAYPDYADDPKTDATLIRHGNYDYFDNETKWDPAIADHVIPNSYYLVSKPAWFGYLAWPPIGPDVPGYHRDIPAAWRWRNYQDSGLLADLFADTPIFIGGLFSSGRKAILDGTIHWITDIIKVIGVDADIHDPDLDVDEFLDDIDAGAILFTSGGLAGKTSTGGVADADDITITGVLSGVEVDCLVIFKDTGDPSTSTLIAKVHASTGIVFKANGANFDVVWPAAGILSL